MTERELRLKCLQEATLTVSQRFPLLRENDLAAFIVDTAEAFWSFVNDGPTRAKKTA